MRVGDAYSLDIEHGKNTEKDHRNNENITSKRAVTIHIQKGYC